MTDTLQPQTLIDRGLDPETAKHLCAAAEQALSEQSPEEAWASLRRKALELKLPFEVHLLLHRAVFQNGSDQDGPAPVWTPDPDTVKQANLHSLMTELGLKDYRSLHRWTADHPEEFWGKMAERLAIQFRTPPSATLDLKNGVENPVWFPEAKMNIVDTCFSGDPEAMAVVYMDESGDVRTLSYGELDRLSDRVAHGLRGMGLEIGDPVAVYLSMTPESLALYLGILKAGCVMVAIADSFSPEQVQTRIRISQAKAIFTEYFFERGGKKHYLYEKVRKAQAPAAIVMGAASKDDLTDPNDLLWENFLGGDQPFDSVECAPSDPTTLLFSSGTTADPKAIPWDHTTPIKAAVDGHLHHDIHPGEIVAWPTSLGWMMGPWLLFASLINRATVALYGGAPTGRDFGTFVETACVNILGVVPSLVRTWRQSKCMEGLDWSSIRLFSSTGETSNAEDMFYLMWLAGYRPIIEYCGGTEIGGGYIAGTVVQPQTPGVFSTPVCGLDFVLLDEEGSPAEEGEVYLIPPSMGMSRTLLNADHHKVYFEGTPAGPNGEKLRRHGDRMRAIGGGYFRAEGRVDDAMNLGGIKVSAAEIERAIGRVEGLSEVAAIAVPSLEGGPDRLVVAGATRTADSIDPSVLRKEIQTRIREKLNPLFKVEDLLLVEALPRTASNKIMRRILRDRYREKESES